ncbi:MAG TPA: polysaccharide biosynthesis protein [Candidatus Dormibacteraeota bacterium]|nr:polysaccharide biosynthesis protein [Candidatus Dormibacteraeota bacterium]
MRGAARYGPIFFIEVALFWLIIRAVEATGYGHPSAMYAPSWYPLVSLLVVALAMGAGEARFHLYRRVWSVAGLNDAFALGLAVVEASLLVTIINLLFPDGYRPFRVLSPLLAAPAVVIAVGLLRLIPRLLASGRATGNRLLVVIPDASGYATVKALMQHPSPDWAPVAVVTTGAADVGRTLMGIPVIGSATNLGHWIRLTAAQGVAFVHTATSDRDRERQLYTQCLAAQVPVFVLPAADEWFPRPSSSRLRQLSADDLVGRDHREIDLAQAAIEVRNRTVLVTGAAGSIGSELSRLLAAMSPRRLILVDTNESGLFDLGEELRVGTNVELREALVSIVDRNFLLDVFADERPDIVFHVAAYKHVPMLESHPVQGVLTNVVGTWNTVRCADATGVQRFILVSTDKAASKHSVMGCTKRLCEQIVLAYDGKMTCWAVRFGNVVGSRGSVIPLFERQIEMGGPVTITHQEATRYMMTIREAAALVLSTLVIGRASHLYMLDMGEPIRIFDLAHSLIRSRGLRPNVDIDVVFTGLRPGERLTEELLGADEGWRPTTHPAIREVVSPRLGKEEDLAWTVDRLERLAREGKSDELIHVLKQAVQAPATPAEEPDAPGRGAREPQADTGAS